jgi:hypothetical protein
MCLPFALLQALQTTLACIAIAGTVVYRAGEICLRARSTTANAQGRLYMSVQTSSHGYSTPLPDQVCTVSIAVTTLACRTEPSTTTNMAPSVNIRLSRETKVLYWERGRNFIPTTGGSEADSTDDEDDGLARKRVPGLLLELPMPADTG